MNNPTVYGKKLVLENNDYAQIEVLVKLFDFLFELFVSMFLVFLRFDLEHFGLESSGRSVGKNPPSGALPPKKTAVVTSYDQENNKVDKKNSTEYFNVSVQGITICLLFFLLDFPSQNLLEAGEKVQVTPGRHRMPSLLEQLVRQIRKHTGTLLSINHM